MHLSSDAKDLLVYKCTILTAMMRRLTSLFLSYVLQINVSCKQNQSQKRCEARDISNAQTDLSLRHTHVL